MMVNEAKLLRRLQKEAKNSIDEAIEIYTPYVSTVLYNIAGSALPKEDIEEIVSDVFVSLWRNAKNIDLNKGTMRSYLAASARNFALKRLNRIKEHTYLLIISNWLMKVILLIVARKLIICGKP